MTIKNNVKVHESAILDVNGVLKCRYKCNVNLHYILTILIHHTDMYICSYTLVVNDNQLQRTPISFSCQILLLDSAWSNGYLHISLVASTDTVLLLTGTVETDFVVVGDAVLLVTSSVDDVVVTSVVDDDLVVVVVDFVEESTLVVGLTVVGFAVVGFS